MPAAENLRPPVDLEPLEQIFEADPGVERGAGFLERLDLGGKADRLRVGLLENGRQIFEHEAVGIEEERLIEGGVLDHGLLDLPPHPLVLGPKGVDLLVAFQQAGAGAGRELAVHDADGAG